MLFRSAFRTYATLPPRSAVMLGTWRVGSDGEYFMQRSLNDLVQNNPRVPIFSVTGTGIGDTAIGGYVPEYENGAEVIANQIRKYYDTDDIEDAHFHTSKSLYLFDSRKLKELKIAEYALPKGSVVEDTVAAKLSKYSHYIELLVAGIVLLVLLLVFVAALFLLCRLVFKVFAQIAEFARGLDVLENFRAQLELAVADFLLHLFDVYRSQFIIHAYPS